VVVPPGQPSQAAVSPADRAASRVTLRTEGRFGMRPFLPAGLACLFLAGTLSPGAETKLKTLPDMIRALKDPDNKDLRILAATRIRELGTAGQKAVPDLIVALRDNDKQVRTQARKALAAIGPAAVPDLCRALKTKNQIVRNHVVSALAVMGPAAMKG